MMTSRSYDEIMWDVAMLLPQELFTELTELFIEESESAYKNIDLNSQD